jgi:hypothetical protein
VLGHIQIRTETPGVMLWVFFLASAPFGSAQGPPLRDRRSATRLVSVLFCMFVVSEDGRIILLLGGLRLRSATDGLDL